MENMHLPVQVPPIHSDDGRPLVGVTILQASPTVWARHTREIGGGEEEGILQEGGWSWQSSFHCAADEATADASSVRQMLPRAVRYAQSALPRGLGKPTVTPLQCRAVGLGPMRSM